MLLEISPGHTAATILPYSEIGLSLPLGSFAVIMSDYESLSLVFVVIGLVLVAMDHDGNKKGRH